jgi:hypothetical protein
LEFRVKVRDKKYKNPLKYRRTMWLEKNNNKEKR